MFAQDYTVKLVEPGFESRFQSPLSEPILHPLGLPHGAGLCILLPEIFLCDLWEAALYEHGASKGCLEIHIHKDSL